MLSDHCNYPGAIVQPPYPQRRDDLGYPRKLRRATAVCTVTAMSKERLLVAKSVEVQLSYATDLLRQAVTNLAALQHGVQPALEAARKALAECERAHGRTQVMIERIPVPDGWK